MEKKDIIAFFTYLKDSGSIGKLSSLKEVDNVWFFDDITLKYSNSFRGSESITKFLEGIQYGKYKMQEAR